MSTVDYARVSWMPQHTQMHHDAFELADCVRVFEDKLSSRVTHRPGLTTALDYLRNEDTLCIWKLDRLGDQSKRSSPWLMICTTVVFVCGS